MTTIETYAALEAAFTTWSALSDPDAQGRTVYQRIAAGRAYMAVHPDSVEGAKLLAELEAKAVRAEAAYWVANEAYKSACDAEREVAHEP